MFYPYRWSYTPCGLLASYRLERWPWKQTKMMHRCNKYYSSHLVLITSANRSPRSRKEKCVSCSSGVLCCSVWIIQHTHPRPWLRLFGSWVAFFFFSDLKKELDWKVSSQRGPSLSKITCNKNKNNKLKMVLPTGSNLQYGFLIS